MASTKKNTAKAITKTQIATELISKELSKINAILTENARKKSLNKK